MNKDNNTFDAQDAPEKNTDAAFVQVGTDGKPKLPENEKAAPDKQEQRPKEGTLADR